MHIYYCAYIVYSETDLAMICYSPYTAFGDLEIFLHGLGLEHMTDLLKVGFHIKQIKFCMCAYIRIKLNFSSKHAIYFSFICRVPCFKFIISTSRNY